MDKIDQKFVLLIAYHFPPIRVSSGIQRTLKFSQYLLDYAWKPIVLSAHPRAYGAFVSQDQMAEIHDDIKVKRAFALDTSNHLALFGRYSQWMALPDRWVTWAIGGAISGVRLIRRYRPSIIWSTFPIATALLIGLILHRMTGIPWVADFRDSMTEDDYPQERKQWKVYRWIEQQTIKYCSKAIFTTPGAVAMYRERYPEIPESKWSVIANGFDEANFTRADEALNNSPRNADSPATITLLHSGLIYPTERDPRDFFEALSNLAEAGKINRGEIKIVLRASGQDEYLGRLIDAANLNDFVTLEPGIGYESALAEMMTADGLLILQAANCNHQIPAKIYEYLRAKRPILALTDPTGDTAGLLTEAGYNDIARLDQVTEIEIAFLRFVDRIRQKSAYIADDEIIANHSREARTKQLAALFDEVVAGRN